jgi:hypothetical protein
VLSYSNFLGISIFLFEETIGIEIQEKVLKEVAEILYEIAL